MPRSKAQSVHARSIVVFTPFRSIGVIKEALRFRYSAMSENPGLQIRNDGIDFLGAELARCRELADAAAPARRRCALIEGRHSGPRTPASDGQLQRGGIESAGSQVRAGRRLVAFLFAVREGAVAI